MPAAAFSGEPEIMRGDLARISTRHQGRHRIHLLGDSIAELTDLSDGVEVRFERAHAPQLRTW